MKSIIKKGVKAFSILTLTGFLTLGPVACAHEKQSTKTYPVPITHFTDNGMRSYSKDSSVLETLILGLNVEQDIGDIINSINPSAFKVYKIWFDSGKDPFTTEKVITPKGLVKRLADIDGKKIYESVTISEDMEIILAHQIWKYNNKKTSEGKNLYLVKYEIFEGHDEDLRSGGGSHTVWLDDSPWMEGCEREYINNNKEKKLINSFFKMEEINGKADIKGYGSGGKTYYRLYD